MDEEGAIGRDGLAEARERVLLQDVSQGVNLVIHLLAYLVAEFDHQSQVASEEETRLGVHFSSS